jgi:L-rhamnose isomerase
MKQEFRHIVQALERDGDTTGRLALLEELKGLPVGAVWDYHCLTRVCRWAWVSR